MVKFALLAIAASALFSAACPQPAQDQFTPQHFVLVASTPGDAAIKSMLDIPQSTGVDFIRWRLDIDTVMGKFQMELNFGLCKNNTLGFQHGGEHKTITGGCRRTKINGLPVYALTLTDGKVVVRLQQFNPDIFHLLDVDDRLMKGNGGWSYTLNRESEHGNNAPLTSAYSVGALPGDSVVVFDGRTPCEDFATAYQLPVHDHCIKIKWRITLRRDPVTGAPTTCTIRKILRSSEDLNGVWSIVKGIPNAPNALAYQLNINPIGTITLLPADENVLLLLDKQQRLFVGNENFSYTFNRK